MFKSVLRFVKSAHFFAFTIACIFGVFVTTNAVAVQACSSGKYYHVIEETCKTCPSTDGWNSVSVSCSSGYWVCGKKDNYTYVPALNPEYNWGHYACLPIDKNNNFTSGGQLRCDGKTYTSCRLRKLECNSTRTGCKGKIQGTSGGYTDNCIEVVYKIKASASGAEDPVTRTRFDDDHLNNASNWEVVEYNYQAMPGYYKSSNGTCTHCSGGLYSPGGYLSSCLECPFLNDEENCPYVSNKERDAIVWGMIEYSNNIDPTPGYSYDGVTCSAGPTNNDSTGTFVSACSFNPVNNNTVSKDLGFSLSNSDMWSLVSYGCYELLNCRSDDCEGCMSYAYEDWSAEDGEDFPEWLEAMLPDGASGRAGAFWSVGDEFVFTTNSILDKQVLLNAMYIAGIDIFSLDIDYNW